MLAPVPMELSVLTPVLIGLAAGFVVGMTSTGGGALLTPLLVLVLGVPPSIAIATDMVIAAVMKLVGGSFYALRGQVHWGTTLRLAIGSIPGSLMGVIFINALPAADLDLFLRSLLGYVLMAAGGATILRLVSGRRIQPATYPAALFTVALGLLIGFLVSVTSVGSGSLLLCVLTFFYPLSATTMVGTDLVHALLISSVAAGGHLLAGRVDLALAAVVLVGAVPGVLIGARIATAVPERVLRAAIAMLLVGLGWHLAVTSTAPEVVAGLVAPTPDGP